MTSYRDNYNSIGFMNPYRWSVFVPPILIWTEQTMRKDALLIYPARFLPQFLNIIYETKIRTIDHWTTADDTLILTYVHEFAQLRNSKHISTFQHWRKWTAPPSTGWLERLPRITQFRMSIFVCWWCSRSSVMLIIPCFKKCQTHKVSEIFMTARCCSFRLST